MRLTNRVRAERVMHGIRQSDLAALAGVGRSTIGDIETGEHIPRVDVALLIARALGVTVETIFTLDEGRDSDALEGRDH